MNRALFLAAMVAAAILLHLDTPLVSCRLVAPAEAELAPACDPDPAAAKRRQCARYGDRCQKNMTTWCKRYHDAASVNACMAKVASHCDLAACEARAKIRTCPAGKTCRGDGRCG